jgi:hypothetical protein
MTWKYLSNRGVSQQVSDAREVTIHINVDFFGQGEVPSRIRFDSMKPSVELFLLLGWLGSATHINGRVDESGAKQGENA